MSESQKNVKKSQIPIFFNVCLMVFSKKFKNPDKSLVGLSIRRHCMQWNLLKLKTASRRGILVYPYFASKSSVHDVTHFDVLFRQSMVGTKFSFAHRCKMDSPKDAESFALLSLLVWQILRKNWDEAINSPPPVGRRLTHAGPGGLRTPLLVFRSFRDTIFCTHVCTSFLHKWKF